MRILKVLSMFVCLGLIFTMSSLAPAQEFSQKDPCAAPNVRTDVRPDPEGTPTVVSVGVRMIDLTGISDVKQMLTGDFGVSLTWKDPRLAHLEGCEISLDKIWSPSLVFLNSGRRFTSRPREVGIGTGGRVTYVQRYYGDYATYHNLKDFPFDEQTFRISLTPIQLGEKDVKLVVNEQITGRRDLLNISDWKIGEAKGEVDNYYADVYGRHHSRYSLLIPARRITTYYLWKVLLPLCLIVIMSWAVFWIDPAQFGPQIGLSATSMLTLIAFLFATSNMLPELGYFTILDIFISGSTVLVFLALLEAMLTSYLVSRELGDLSRKIDRVCRVVFPLAFIAFLSIVSSL